MLKEDELAARLEDPSYTLNCLHHAGNRAQRKGAHNCIDACVCQGNAFSGQIEKLDIHLRSTPLFFCAPKHPRIGFECIDPGYSCRIVMNEVHAGTHADLKDISSRQGDYALPDFLDGFRISQHTY